MFKLAVKTYLVTYLKIELPVRELVTKTVQKIILKIINFFKFIINVVSQTWYLRQSNKTEEDTKPQCEVFVMMPMLIKMLLRLNVTFTI